MSRVELETVMGQVITNRSVADRFQADPKAFAASSALDPVEQEWLVAMCSDLTALTPEFVTKRTRVLRVTGRRTLGMLGEVGEEWLTEYVDSTAPVAISGNDAARWIKTLVANVESHAQELPYPTVIRSMVRLEQMCQRAFRTPGQPSDVLVPEPPYARAQLRLHPSTDVASLEHDVVGVRDPTPETAAALPYDPCEVVVYRARRGAVKSERISDPALFDALIELSSGPSRLDDLVSVVGGTDKLRAEIVRLYRWGALTA